MTRSVERVTAVFPPDLAVEISDFVTKSHFSYGWKSTFSVNVPGHWNSSFVEASSSNSLDVSDKLDGLMKRAWEHIAQSYPEMALLRCYANLHTYGIEGYPHTDSARDSDFTLVTYMNRDWNIMWGGETQLFKDGEIYFSQLPKFNQGVFFPGKMLHCARGVTRLCQAPRHTLMFKMGIKDADPARDQMQRYLERIEANEKAHTGRKLADHLLGTYDLLKANKQAPHVCMAGAAHSLLGTNAFTDITLKTDDARDELKNFIGSRAFDLVLLFSTIDRPKTLEEACQDFKGWELRTREGRGTTPVTPAQFADLCVLEAANLREQNILRQFPKLEEVWNAVLKAAK